VQSGLRKNISSVAVDIERAMGLAIRAKMLSEKFHKGQRWVAEYVRDQQEQKIADLLDEARREHAENIKPVLWAHVADRVQGISDHQREQLKLATSGFVGILSGRPGSGKTYTVARFVQALKEEFGEQHIAIATPTGKASVRATAAMNAVGIPLVASTSHSLLGFSGSGFAFNRERPLQFLFVDIDEDSMTDVVMKKAMLEARAEGAHMLFVGDPNQLAPVGHGAPLRDMIFAEIPHGELKEVQRNSGRIVKACGEIIDRGRFTTSPKLNVAEGENLLLIERANPESQIDTLAALMVRFQRDFAEGKTDAVDPIWDCQIIVAVNAKSELGRKPLNAKLQDLLNPDGHRVSGNPFRIGDKIINTKNSQYKIVAQVKEMLEIDDLPSEPTTCYVANGEQAEVLDVDATKIIARLTSPDRVILIPRSVKQVSEEGDSPDQGNESEESTGSGCAWELGYAISGHKSQGSEWPIVIVMVDDYNGAKMVQSKQWLYTAISRAKKTCFLIGQQKTVNQCCQRDALFQRKTFLRERILDLRKPVIMPISDESLEQLLEIV
jgi:ATP-dependent exoDNAse (exonuclease V) alpha subunit